MGDMGKSGWLAGQIGGWVSWVGKSGGQVGQEGKKGRSGRCVRYAGLNRFGLEDSKFRTVSDTGRGYVMTVGRSYVISDKGRYKAARAAKK